MARRPPVLALLHILDAADLLGELLQASPTAQALAQDRRNRAAAERMVEIISEASRRLPETWTSEHPDVPWRNIAAIGNILRHGYDLIELEVIAGLANGPLQTLTSAVEQLLDRERPGWREERERLRSD